MVFSFSLIGLPVQEAQGSSALWREVATGIEYREFFLPLPNHVYVTRMDRDNPNVILESSIGQGRLSGGLETVREMANRYDQAINYWGGEWGARNQVVVAINGFFYDTETGIPWNGQFQSSWYAKRFDERHSGSGIVWTLSRDIFIGGCITHPDQKQTISLTDSSEVLTFDGINIPRGENKLVIYTSHFDAATPPTKEGLEVLVEMSRPLMVQSDNANVIGIIREIQDGQGEMPIPFDHIVLSASGKAREQLLPKISIGEEIAISQRIRHFENDCRTPSLQEWADSYAGIGSSFQYLRDGVLQPLQDLGAVLRSPRTAIAYNERYIFFIVVDGRDPFQSLGMSIVELATFAKTYLGANWGVALDGGGSSTMVVNGEVRNTPNTEVQNQGSPAAGISTERIERAVANGMMMVVVQPKEVSMRFTVGSHVNVPASTEIRLGPGSNYSVLSVIGIGQEGIVVEHKLNGVLAKGSYWWKVSFNNLVGWVSEETLLSP